MEAVRTCNPLFMGLERSLQICSGQSEKSLPACGLSEIILIM
jgi:hypothetical protein